MSKVVTDANVSDRPFALGIISPDNTELAVLMDSTVQTASSTVTHCWFPGSTLFGVVQLQNTTHVFPDFTLEEGWRCQLVPLNPEAADTISLSLAIWEEAGST